MVHDGKTMDGNAEDGGVRRMSSGRVAAALSLLLPWVAGAPWSVSDFISAGILLFGSLGAYEVAARMAGDSAYRAGAGVAIAAAFLLIWINAAVGITDSDADGMYLAVVAVGWRTDTKSGSLAPRRPGPISACCSNFAGQRSTAK